MIGFYKQAVKPVLIHKVAKTPVASSSLDELLIPGLGKITQLGGRDVTDVNLMGRVSRGRTKAPKLVF